MYKNLALLLALAPAAHAMPATSMSFTANHADGTPTACIMKLIGNPGYHYVVCEDGVSGSRTTAINQSDGHIYYAELNDAGRLVPSNVEVSSVNDPVELGIPLHQTESVQVMEEKCKENDFCKWKLDNDGLSGSGPPSDDYDNLVVPVFFQDHTDRKIQWNALFNTLFDGPKKSVKHYFESQSFGKLQWMNIMTDPVIIPFTESECADNVSGTSSKMQECLRAALGLVVDQGKLSPEDYDGVTFVHSGYGAEAGNNDAYHKYFDDRIWSHSWEVSSDSYSGRYALISAYAGHHNAKRQHLGVAVHEIAQMLGAPTQYGPEPGNGLGNYDVMAHPYGFDGDAKNCGSLSAYTRVLLEWAEVVEITESGTYAIESSLKSNKVYKISRPFSIEDEYYLIENRVNDGYDTGMHGPGLAIYHIDGTANGKPGYPGDDKAYPKNHYEVSLIQADGRFDLEMEEDQGDMSDLFHYGGYDGITPEGPLFNGAPTDSDMPNTDSYSNGSFARTGLTIKDISLPGETMQFTVEFSATSTAQ